MRILCLGASYTGRYLAENFPEHEVQFISRDAAALEAHGLRAFSLASGGGAETAKLSDDRPTFDLILDTLPAVADEAGNKPAEHPYRGVIDELCTMSPETRLIHISSTSVYAAGPPAGAAQSDMPRFDESVVADPGEERGRVRLRLEERLRANWPGLFVIRATGIYGPKRSLALRFRAGDFRRVTGGNKIVSRIHVHDLCRLILALALADEPPETINAVDRKPTANAEVFAWLEERLAITIPGDWRDAEVQGRAITSRHADTLLGGRFRFPTYREGFEDSLNRE